ncbi:DUF3820 family protein [Sinomicrobium soli]|uniref:DUF3820 family protein n=1 Tax=Sinomicrobium sp. N-1-3-6 TaxID=2219864 RepID=UPI000DCC6651|nr:DUF3820 family protein [Sinomicrobium sp. N-1-3-6]RAV30604.1 hypothetical protein DN748_03675 [Sinomicrobium sp. N-1-3-6]
METGYNREFLEKLAKARMPFGKYKDRYLTELPEAYLVWFRQKGFPGGTLGKQLEAVLEIKANGLEQLLRNIRNITE